MTTVQVVETSVTVNNCPIQDYTYPDDHIPSTYDNTYLLKFCFHATEEIYIFSIY